MRIAFSCPAVPGHLHPMTALACKLRGRNHEVFFLCLAEAEPMVRSVGLDFFPFGEAVFPAGEYPRRLRALSQLSGNEALEFTMGLYADVCRAALEDGERAIRESRAEALVLDATSRGLNLVAMQLKLPFIQVSNALHVDFSGHAPLCVYDWPHQAGPEGYARNIEGINAVRKMTAPMVALERDYVARVGLSIDVEDPTSHRSKLAQLTQTPKEFDFPGDHWPAHFHYTGPWHDPSLRPPVDFPWDKLTGEPLIYASMGTLQNGAERIFEVIVAAAQTPGRQLVLSIGKNLDADKVGRLSANTIVVRSAPQLEVLKRASLCITHAGLNTALESLTAGVPMVAIPVTNDQPGVGARIAHTGTGVVVPLKTLAGELAVQKLRAAIETVLTDGSYRENTRRIQQAIESTNGLTMAADLIDHTLRGAVQPSPTETTSHPVGP
jgi:zeaxanthin glucosyltransferase